MMILQMYGNIGDVSASALSKMVKNKHAIMRMVVTVPATENYPSWVDCVGCFWNISIELECMMMRRVSS